MMRLVFDTSSSAVSLGLWTEEGWMETVDHEDVQKQQSKVLLSLIRDLLRPFGIEAQEITEIVVGEGPGSYTGLRMGHTVAKVWAYAQKIDIYVFSSADLLKKTQAKEPGARFPKVKYLEMSECKKLDEVNRLSPVYENDHFAP